MLITLITSCALPGWDTELKAFVETGLSTAYLKSASYTQQGNETNADVRSGEPVTVTVLINNPKKLALAYTLGYDESLVAAGTTAAPADTATATDGVTTATFTFTPAENAEHGDVSFSLGMVAPEIGKTFTPAAFTVHCDSVPDPVNNLVAGVQSDNRACIGFTLSENYANADVTAVEITWKNNMTGKTRTVTNETSQTGTGLTAIPQPALLNSNVGKYIRYYLPEDVIPGNPYTFTVVTIDASGKRSVKATNPAQVSVTGTEVFLGYDANGGTGTVGAQFGYNATTTVSVADSASLAREHHSFINWNTAANGSGTTYSPGTSFTFPATNTMLYAQWMLLGDVVVTLSDPAYASLSFAPSATAVRRGTSLTVTGTTNPAGSDWAWSVDGVPSADPSASTSAFTWNAASTSGASIGAHTISCTVAYNGITYSGSLIVTVVPRFTVSYDGNGNTGGAVPAAQEFDGGEMITLAAVAPGSLVKSGYVFAGWATTASGSGVEYTPSGTYTMGSSSLKLYAVWTNDEPDPVTNLVATSGDRKVTLTWTDPSDADLGYIEITVTKIDDSSLTSFVATYTVAKGAQTCVVKDLESGRVYTFNVVAHDDNATPLGSPVETITKMPYLEMTSVISSGSATFTQTELVVGSGAPQSFRHTLDAFQMGKFEVTYEQWYEIWSWAVAHGYTFTTDHREYDGNGGGNCALPTPSNYSHPVTNIIWYDCIVWCNALSEYMGLTPCYYTSSSFSPSNIRKDNSLITDSGYRPDTVNWTASGYRLPTEGEWEYAASNAGSTPFNYASGASSASKEGAEVVAWGGSNSEGHTHAVGTRRANSFGIFDMSGNVAEWLWDRDGPYPVSPQTNYRGSDASAPTTRYLMGGAYAGTYNVQLRIGERHLMTPTQIGVGGGLRVCRGGGF